MALKQIMLSKRKSNIEKELEELREKEESLIVRESELESAIEEAETEEEQEAVETEIEEYEEEKTTLKDKKKELEEEIVAIDEELAEIENRSKENKIQTRSAAAVETREMGDINLKVNKYETREQMLNRLAVPEVKDFYENLRTAIVEKRSLDKAELLIPEQVMLAIQHRIGDYGVLIKKVRNINLKGTARLIMNSGSPKLFWTEKCESLQESALGALNEVEIDGFKLGGYLFICNALIEDSMIDLANYVEEEFAKAIARFKDRAVMNGKGVSAKEPEGIRTIVTEVEEVEGVLGVLMAIGDLGYEEDDDTDMDYEPEEIIAVMNRKTYYQKVLPETYGKNADGNLVFGIGRNLPDGTPIEISKTVPTGEVVLGDFGQGYIWADRKTTSFDTNDRLKWVEEQTGFKVSGRHDGKVVHKNFFKRVKFKDVATTPETPEA